MMSLNTLRKIACDLQLTKFVCIMMDECADFSKKEHVKVLVCIAQHKFAIINKFQLSLVII